jgi:hypothetical protein
VRRLGLLLLAAPLAAQAPPDSVPRGTPTVTIAPGAHYRAGAIHRLVLGADYRNLWTTPVELNVLDMEHYAGGLTALGRTGGQESKTLKLGTADGHQFFFRSIDKDPSLALPAELRGTVAAWVVQDQIKAANPLGPLVVSRLMTGTGILHNSYEVFVLPDDPRLGEFRADFAGLLGTLEERIGGPGPAAHWHGVSQIIDSDTLFALVDRSPADRVDARAFLAARLFDVFIGDWDRHRDQWRWARLTDETPRMWRPIPLDRDQAFVRFDGVALSVARQTVPNLVKFGDQYAKIVGQTWNGRDLDRRFLVELTWPVWDSVAKALQTALTDSVIADAVRGLPPKQYELAGKRLEERLRHRRDALLDQAGKYFHLLNQQVDVHGTGQTDIASATRESNGDVTLTLNSSGAEQPWFQRRFEAGMTHDLRIYLGGGADTAVVHGRGGPITIRIIGESGQDLLADSSGSSHNRYYDDDASATNTAGTVQTIDRRPFVVQTKPGQVAPRDWGLRWLPGTWLSGGPDIGLFVGGIRTLTYYGFRKLPWSSQHRFRAGIATGPWTYRIDYLGEFRRQNSRSSFELYAGASGIEVLRFHGFGNETSAAGDDSFYRVNQKQYRLAVSMSLGLGSKGTLRFGPALKYASTDVDESRFLATVDPYGNGHFGEIGVRSQIRFDLRDRKNAATKGGTFELGGALYPGVWDVRKTFGEAHAEGTLFISPKAPLDPTFAFRAGGKKVWGDFPFFDAAYIGGVETVRLGRVDRYAGDASAYGSAELRLALGHARLILPADFGIFGLADAGRVFLDGELSDVWHSAFGGGVWLAYLSRANTFSAYVAASDERTRLYVSAGFGF